MADFGLQFLSLRKNLPLKKPNAGMKYVLSQEEEAILDRQHVSYSPYMMYIPAPHRDTMYARGTRPTVDDAAPTLSKTPTVAKDVAMRKEQHKRVITFGANISRLLSTHPNLKLVHGCIVTNSSGEKVLRKPELIAALKVSGITNEIFMETAFMHLDGQETGMVKYQTFLSDIDAHVNGEHSSKTIRACFDVFRTKQRDSILWREIKALRGARQAEANAVTNGGTFPMLKVLFDIWPEREGVDPLVMDYDEFEGWMRKDARVVAAFLEEILRQILVLNYKCRREDLLVQVL